jgi:hypothetical protein
MRDPRGQDFGHEAPTSVMQDDLLQKLTQRSRREDAPSFDLLPDAPTAVAKRSAEELFAEAARCDADESPAFAPSDGPSPPVAPHSSPLAVDELSATSKWTALHDEPVEPAQTPPKRKTVLHSDWPALRRRLVALMALALTGACLGVVAFHHLPRRRTAASRAAVAAVQSPLTPAGPTGKLSMDARPAVSASALTPTSPPTR